MSGEKSSKDGIWDAIDRISHLSEIAEFIMMALGNKHVAGAAPGPERKEVMLQQLPSVFGGKADERIWGELLVALGAEKLPKLTSLMSAMTEHEREQFRIIVTGMKAQMLVGGKNIEFTEKDIRVRFLDEIVTLVKDSGSRAAVHILRAHQFIGGKSHTEKAKIFIAKFLGLADIEDLAEPAKVVGAINDQRLKIQAKRNKVFKRNILGRLFGI